MNFKIIVSVAGKAKRFGVEFPKQFYNITDQLTILNKVKKLITSPLINGGVIVYGIDNKIRIVC